MISQLSLLLSQWPSSCSRPSAKCSRFSSRGIQINIEGKHVMNSGFQPICNATSSSQASVFKNSVPSFKDDLDQAALHQVHVIRKKINTVQKMLGSMEDGEISISAYDTAWTALVKNVDDRNRPQFPSCLQWIANNQLDDGSWGDNEIFTAHDRILNTLACVIALTSWNMHPEKCEKGIAYFKENLDKLQDENAEHMPIGFEVAFFSLLQMARSMNIEVPHDSPIFKDIFAMRDLKLKKYI
ncbi:putative ent-copalyl diphosphate synthase [Lupinus albus]|uniref:Putative ent-copalyl diphosphate synthase n=1 Tax=Lupinus albus TaxID=3870 RepID=A0A6A4NNF2_LUPAL|nr:putative ent-copalyl diphosphate synthase [Lupinus albus]